MKTLLTVIADTVTNSRERDLGFWSNVANMNDAVLDWMEERIPNRIEVLTASGKDEYSEGWNACRDYFLKRIKEERG